MGGVSTAAVPEPSGLASGFLLLGLIAGGSAGDGGIGRRELLDYRLARIVFGEAKMLGPTVRRELWPLVLILLSPLPLFVEHLHNLWRVKPHYQFFPLLLIGFGCLLWPRWPRTRPGTVPSRWGVAFWAAA